MKTVARILHLFLFIVVCQNVECKLGEQKHWISQLNYGVDYKQSFDSQNVADYSEVLGKSCKGRCNINSVPAEDQCQCHDVCFINGDCCDDYISLCEEEGEDYKVIRSNKRRIADDDLKKFSEDLLKIERNKYTPFYQYYVGEDNVGDCSKPQLGRLLRVSESCLEHPTIKKLTDIQNSGIFNADITKADNYDDTNPAIMTFIDEVYKTSTWKRAERILDEIGETVDKKRFYTLWFGQYSRSGSHEITSSSGFEHVFLGEVRTDKREILGFHNWIYYNTEQKENVGQNR